MADVQYPYPPFAHERGDEHEAVGAPEARATESLDEAQEKGFYGQTPDPEPNSAHSLESGPDSPQLVDDDRTRVPQHSLDPNA